MSPPPLPAATSKTIVPAALIGFSADEEYCDMIAAGIVDPTKVCRSAIENAASIAGIVLTTESLVADLPEKEPAMPAPNPGMGGMY